MPPTITPRSSLLPNQFKENLQPRTPSARKSGQPSPLIPDNILNLIQIAIHQQIAEQQAQQSLSMDSQSMASQSLPSNTRLKKEKKRCLSESSQGQNEIETKLNLREWEVCQGSIEFNESKQIVNKYLSTFLGKKECKQKKSPSKLTIEKLFAEKVFRVIADEASQSETNEPLASFEAIREFFKKSPLFHQISNIHPNALRNLLERSARTYPAALTTDQFTHFFDLNNSAQDFNSFQVDKVQTQCVLTPKDWGEVKQIFDRLDVFGRQTAPIKKLLKSLQKVKELTDRTAITFSLGRSYSFNQIVWELLNKFIYTETEQITWENFQKKIMEFSHIESPTIDQIKQRQLSLGQIDSNTNGFLISAELLQNIKTICGRMPKYGGQFYKTRHFCCEIAERKDFEVSAGEPVRTIPNLVTLKQTLHSIKTNAPPYLNLDQIILCFSIKGCPLLSTPHSKSVSQSSKDSERPLRKKIMQVHLPKQKVQKKSVHHETVPVKFNLTEPKSGIRAQKVKEMIEQLQRKENRELSKKFKAKAIPISNNPQRYNEYRLEMQKIKDGIKDKLQQRRTADQQMLEYLKTNTKLLQVKSNVCPQSVCGAKFEANTVPWNTHIPLLEHIQKDKKARREGLRKESKEKYSAAWKKLPSVVTGAEQFEGLNIKTQSECDLLNEFADLVKDSPRIKPVPDFHALHRQFQKELQRKKKQIQPTIPQEFHLSKPNLKPIQQLERQNIEKVSKAPQRMNNAPLIKSTAKYDAMVAMKAMKEQLEEEKQTALEQQMQKQRMRKRHFKRYVQQCLKMKLREEKGRRYRSHRSHRNNRNDRSDRNRNKKWIGNRRDKMRNRSVSPEMEKMYERVWQRPLLLECGSMRSETAKAVRIPRREQMGID